MSNPGGFPTQQFPSHNAMANGPQHMNGISSQQDPARHNPAYYNQQPKQPLPPKVTIIACIFCYLCSNSRGKRNVLKNRTISHFVIDINTRKQISKLSSFGRTVALIKSITYITLVETLSVFVILMCRCESIIPYLLAVHMFKYTDRIPIYCVLHYPACQLLRIICTIWRFELSLGS